MEAKEYSPSCWKVWQPLRIGKPPMDNYPYPRILRFDTTCCCTSNRYYSDESENQIMQALGPDYQTIIDIPRRNIILYRVFYEIFKWLFLVMAGLCAFLFFLAVIFVNGGRAAGTFIWFFIFCLLVRITGIYYRRCAQIAHEKACNEMFQYDALLASKGLFAVVGRYCQWIEFHDANNSTAGNKV